MAALYNTLRDGNGQDRHPNPPGVAAIQLAQSLQKTPFVTEGSFCLQIAPEDPQGRYVVPVEAVSGLPLSLRQIEQPGRQRRKFIDFNHHFHPRADYCEGLGFAGVALRASRGQFVERWLHDRYHQTFYGPKLPVGQGNQFAICILACAGVVPRQVLDLSDGEPRIVMPGNEEYERIRRSIGREGGLNTIKANMSRDKIGKFFADYVLAQNMQDAVDDGVIDEFLHTQNAQRKLKLGKRIISAAIDVKTEPVDKIYLEAFAQGAVRREKPVDLRVVTKNYFLPRRMPDYLETLEAKLAA